MARIRRLIAALGLTCSVVAGAACDGRGGSGATAGDGSPTVSTAVPRPRGGTARVGVWAAPELDAPTLGGAAVRALVYPQLFAAGPDGAWIPSLVEPGSDRDVPDRSSATFRLRTGAVWSDGTAIGAEDLRRSADARFVAGVDGPAPDGLIRVRFTHALPEWRRLWSFTDSVSPPAPGLWGGPFTLVASTPGLETVLRRNDRWSVGPGPFLDELRLVLVPDATTARQLLGKGELDVVMPSAATARTRQLEALPGVTVQGVNRSGWWVGLLLDPTRLDIAARRSVMATVDRAGFVGTLLRDEATVLDGLTSPEDTTWAPVVVGDAGPLRGEGVDLVGTTEEPMTPLLQRSMQKRVREVDGILELRNAEADRVEGWVRAGEFDAAVVPLLDPPQPCWRCRWEDVDAGLATAADAGDVVAATRLESRLRDEALVLPLWRPRAVVAWRDGLGGVRANGYALSGAWNAWEWWREAG